MHVFAIEVVSEQQQGIRESNDNSDATCQVNAIVQGRIVVAEDRIENKMQNTLRTAYEAVDNGLDAVALQRNAL